MPLKDETEPIADDEWLYRRVHTTKFRTAKTPFVSPSAFEPRVNGTHPDTDGISLFRAACVESPDDILALINDVEKRKQNGIVRVSVKEVKELGLSVSSTSLDTISGHVSLPELSAIAIKAAETRPQCKLWMAKLAEFVSPEDRIVLHPEPAIQR